MYDEFERAVTGRSGEGLSILGWISIALGTLFILGMVGAGLAFVRVKHEVTEIAEVVRKEMEVRPTLAAEAMVDRLESHAALLSVPPEEGVRRLQNLESDSPADAFMKEFFGGTLELFPEGRQLMDGLGGVKDQIRDGLLELDSESGRVRMDLVRDGEGGSLVIDSDEGQVRFDLRKTQEGGFLAIDSDEGQVRFDLTKGDDGGSLVITSDEGAFRFDVSGGEEGGTMVVTGEDGTLRFGAGDKAEGMPNWVRRMDAAPSHAKPVYSLSSRDGFMGAVSWQDDGSPREVLRFYRDWLTGEGFEIRVQERSREDGTETASLWARNQDSGRVVFLVAGQDQAATKILLGYGEKE